METVLSARQRQLAVEVADSSAVGAARRMAADICARIALDEVACGQVALATTEAATNILKHAGRGEILARPLVVDGRPGIEIIAIDRGPGMANFARSAADGHTTAGSYGIGLGAMQRGTDFFDIHTAPGQGTVIAMRIYGRGGAGAPSAIDIGAVCLPITGETLCGDAWAVAAGPTLVTALVADGLGHGPQAAAASEAAAEIVERHPEQLPGALMQDVHAGLRGTRGAAAALLRIDLIEDELRFCGVGNIMASVYESGSAIVGGTRRQMVSHNGIVGGNAHKIQEFTQPWRPGSLLVLCSDGLNTRWDLNRYPGLTERHPSVIAAVLYRDFARGRDDVTVLVVREHGG
ncbi:ATP-binding SpoIIE family protein phosphatase [Noviherbaspirillum pedocola]|uniref:SpoIIE family protein phosphatase n=1 Tax=Noviherbaspirillum pedocola TaxID=2801341 RepID=A0A934SZA7_9BURK|nr:ATP-binding SpoIIE family protein phosphatase [Noviherbaspirillum pedocola]MBK4737766.1 SpoIIE family protein phosphatase [Noviherbaspirillum pedocola]